MQMVARPGPSDAIQLREESFPTAFLETAA